MINHNVETCIKKKEQTKMVAIEAAQHYHNPQKTSSYACCICGLNGCKLTDCPKVTKM